MRERHVGAANGVNIDLIPTWAVPRVFYGPICNSMAARSVRVPRFSALCARPPPGPLSEYRERGLPTSYGGRSRNWTSKPPVQAAEVLPAYCERGFVWKGRAGACGCRIRLPRCSLFETESKIDKLAMENHYSSPQSRRVMS